MTESDPSRRRLVSRQLLREAERFCAAHDYHKMELFLPAAATPAEVAAERRLFESAGFRVEKKTRICLAGWIPVADAVFMAKIIELK